MDEDLKATVYAAMCDVAARFLYDIPEQDDLLHTSDEARRLAYLSWERAGLEW